MINVIYLAIDRFKLLSRNNKKVIIVLTDFFLGVFLIQISIFLAQRYFFIADLNIKNSFFELFALLNTLILILFLTNHYSNPIKYLSNRVLFNTFIFFLIIFILFFSLFFFVNLNFLLHSIFLILFFLSIAITRLIAQSLFYKSRINLKNILIYGAGTSGNKLFKSLSANNPEYNVIGFVDDNASKQKERIDSIQVYDPSSLEFLIKKYDCYAIFIAIPSIDSETKKDILVNLINLDIIIKIVPSLISIVEQKSNLDNIRNIEIEDLIDRSSVKPDKLLMNKNINGKNVLITGAGGSIGSELVNQAIQYNPKKIIAVDINELSIFDLKNKFFDEEKIDYRLGSVSDEKFIEIIFKRYNIDVVFHAAAFKHVSIVEENIFYSLYNNISSTYLLCKNVQKFDVQNFVLVSSDKAVNPSNYMGKSKLVSEIIVNYFSKKNKTHFSIVRFGNVLNSSGSVLSIFNNQIKNGGPITVTDKNATRYFMSIPEASQLIIQSSAIFKDCKTFILDMGRSYNIYDLAKKIIRINGFNIIEDRLTNKSNGVEIKITGLKKGEKLHEELTLNPEDLKNTSHPKIRYTSEIYQKTNITQWFDEFILNYRNHDQLKMEKMINSLIENHKKINV